VFKPYAGVSTAVLFFTKTNSGGTDHVWFYDLSRPMAWSLRRQARCRCCLPTSKGRRRVKLLWPKDEHEKNNLPDASRPLV
jgi:type I restriction enzyme M protein